MGFQVPRKKPEGPSDLGGTGVGWGKDENIPIRNRTFWSPAKFWKYNLET